MTAKAKKKATPDEGVADNNAALGQMIAAGDLYASKTNPRKRFPQGSIEELAASIVEHGVIEPLIVRTRDASNLKQPTYEIVCGERRYRAAMLAEQNTGQGNGDTALVPCIVRELTDEQVIEIQIHENLHREDVHPMDEALGYKSLMETLKCDEKDISLRVGKSVQYIANRLKLNGLIKEIQDDLDASIIPLSYALKIARFDDPDTQKAIYDECFESGAWNEERGSYDPDKTRVEQWGTVARWIERYVMYELSKAPFDRKATDLREDGLACTKCPNRTGASRTLFPVEETGKSDRCLLPSCYNAKMEQAAINTRKTIAAQSGIPVEEVPVYDPRKWSATDNGILGAQDVSRCDESTNGAFRAVIWGGDEHAKEVWLQAKRRAGQNGSINESSSETREAELDKKRQRRQEIFEIAVAEHVRSLVLRQAAEKFAEASNEGTNIDLYLPELLTKLWLSSNSGIDGSTLESVVKPLMRDATDSPDGFDWGTWHEYGQTDAESAAAQGIARLSVKHQRRMLFLFIHGNKGNMCHDRYTPQTEIQELADTYDLNYREIDARARVEVAKEKAKKHLDLFRSYLVAVESGDGSSLTPPRPFSENWNRS